MFSRHQIHPSLLVVFFFTISTSGFIDDYGRGNGRNSVGPESADEDALFLTPYIENGQIAEGQKLAYVEPMLKGVESFSGYLTVNKSASSNLFFWLFKSQRGDWEKRPLIMWLQGGPGSSSMFGLFQELGPLSVTKKQKLKRRKYSWNRKCNLVFFDNPVGTGFSFTKDDSAYARTETDVAKDLYEALVQLYKLFPALRKNKLFITGESYAGKYVPAIGYKIYKMNKLSNFNINLAGLMIGNAYTDPINLIDYSSYVYKLGMIDKATRDIMHEEEDETRATIRSGQYVVAEGLLNKELQQIKLATGLNREFDFVDDGIGMDHPERVFLNDPKTRKSIHVGSSVFNDGSDTYFHIQSDIMQSVKPWVEEMLTAEEFPVLFYNGQLDINVAYASSVKFFNNLQWPHATEYYKAKRCQFKVGTEVAGYFKTAGTFTEVLVRNTGHMVTIKQPKWAFELLDRFISNSSSYQC